MRHGYRVRKGQAFLEAARSAYENGHLETALSRAYYAAYHLAAAVLAEKAGIYRARWDHLILHREFLDRFCRRGYLFSRADGDDLADLLNARYDADYNDVSFTARGVERLLGRAEALCAKALRVMAGEAP